MTQADRMLSAPPTNTSALPVDQARRRLLTIAAAGATALTVAPARAAAPAVGVSAPSVNAGPAFALIRAKRLADVKHCWAIEAQAVAETQFGRASDATCLAAERCEAACGAA